MASRKSGDEKIDPNLISGIGTLVKLAAEDNDPEKPKMTVSEKIAIYGLGLKAAGVVEKVAGSSRKGSKFNT